MKELSFNKFRTNLNDTVYKVIEDHRAIRINRRSGKDFVVISVEDWEREQETLYVLSNKSLMRQIAESEIAFKRRKDKI